MVGNRLNETVRASWLAERLNLTLIGSDIEISQVCSLNHISDHALLFSVSHDLTTERLVLVLGSSELARGSVSVLVSRNPRLDFAYALQIFDKSIGFASTDAPPQIDPTVKIGDYVVIGRNVKIGEGTVIHHHVVISDDVQIGRYCTIHSGAVIGEGDMGFERDETGHPVKIKHLGSVTIGDHVQIGSLATISRGTIDNTVIDDHVKIDDHVYVSHNCRIEEKAIITGGSILGGGTHCGRGIWLGINCTTKQKVEVGDHALVGMGAVVLRNVEANAKVVGNPARRLP